MAKKLEIIISERDIVEKKQLEIEYPLYKASYLEVIKIFLNNCKQIEENASIYEYQKYPNNMDNVITIIGSRGGGKTTAMQEIKNVFLNFNEKKKEWLTKIGNPYAEELGKQIDKRFAFSVMDVVDASVLEEKDDLLELILWFMCREVGEKVRKDKYNNKYVANEGERQKFIDALDEVYKMHQSVKGKNEKKYGGESVVTALENMPNSIRTRQAMENLLDIYCKILFPHEYQNAYLVVAIDDLDLNIQKGYQMMEEIRRYLLNWRIIVLLAVDYKQMENVCEAHFFKEFGVRRYDITDNSLERHIGELSNSYMTKVFPFSNRIYLAEQNFKKAKIVDKGKIYSRKGYLLYEIARKMHIFYDANGLKIHFCEPNNVRELVSYVQFLDTLNTIDWQVPAGEEEKAYLKKQLSYYDRNHEKFNQDIIERMAFQILQLNQRDTFNELMKRDLIRRTGYVLQFYENSINEKDDLKKIMEKDHFTFGEFLGCLYEWGRKKYEYKPLVHCLLASFTSEMTREYLNYRYNPGEEEWDKESKQRSKERLIGYVGEGIGGGWLGEGLGKVNTSSNAAGEGDSKGNYEKEIAYLKEESMSNKKFSFTIERTERRGAENKCIRILEEFCKKKILPILECVFMCIDNYKMEKNGKKCLPSVVVEETKMPEFSKEENIGDSAEKRGKHNFKVRVSTARYADIDILSFIRKSIDYDEWRENIGCKIQDGLIEYAKETAGYNTEENKNNKIEAAIEKLKATSIFQNDKKEYPMALPLYNLDLSYNVLKRVRRSCMEALSVSCTSGAVIERINTIYDCIEEELEKNEKKYKEINDDLEFLYTRNFKEDPYIKKFKELMKDEDSKREFSKQLMNLYELPDMMQPEIDTKGDLVEP